MVSTSHFSNQISRLQREIERLQRELAKVSRGEADKSKRIGQIQKSITKHTSASSLQSKSREVERLNEQIARLLAKRADLNKKIADRTAKLHQAQQRLAGSQAKQQKKIINALEHAERDRIRTQSSGLRELGGEIVRQSPAAADNVAAKNYDAFISHASEDKAELVRPLAEALKERGLEIWYDEFELKVGDSLRRSIDKGLANSRFGIVVLSPDFFAKNWPQYELDGLVEKEMQGGEVILPIWHHVSKNDVLEYSPSLAGKFSLATSSYTIEELADKLAEAVRAA